MNERPYHPPADNTNAVFGLLGLVLIWIYFGLGWVGVLLSVDALIDYAIRMWHHNARRDVSQAQGAER